MSDKKHPAPETEGETESPEAQKAREHQDQLLRLRADFENTKKRLEREKQDAIKFANERLLLEVLPVVDNFDRAMDSLTQGHDPQKVKDGLKIAQDELHEILEAHGVKLIESLGQQFDPQFHEAVGTVETASEDEGVVVEEIQRGYTLNGRLIRPSRVKISKKKEA